MNAIVDKQCQWPNCIIKKTLKLDRFLARVWASRRSLQNIYHRYIHVFRFKIVQKKNIYDVNL